MPTGTYFVPRRTTRLVTGDEQSLDVISIARALGERNQHVLGLQPRFGGKAFDITWTNEVSAASAAASGVNINGHHYDLRLLGRRSIDVSVFVSCEYPDEYVTELLEQYGEFDPFSIRHLHLKEDGLEHIENGIRVVTFTRISRAIPSVIVYRGTPLGFRYTGQPKLCFRCASAEHTVRDCPKKRNPEPSSIPEETQLKEQEQIEQNTDIESHNETDRIDTSEGESDNDADTEMTIDHTDRTLGNKRSRPASNPASDTDTNATPAKYQVIPVPEPSTSTDAAISSPTNNTPELFSATPSPENTTTPTDAQTTPQRQMDKQATGPRFTKFIKAMKSNGPARQSLIRLLKPADHYYKARALWLQHTHGDYTTDFVSNKRAINPKEIEAWKELKGCIRQDAFAALLHLYNELTEHYDLFPSK